MGHILTQCKCLIVTSQIVRPKLHTFWEMRSLGEVCSFQGNFCLDTRKTRRIPHTVKHDGKTRGCKV